MAGQESTWQEQGKASHWMWLELKGMKYLVGAQAGKVCWHPIRAGCKCQATLGLYPAGNGEPSKVSEHGSCMFQPVL